jgi:hypothetical protein
MYVCFVNRGIIDPRSITTFGVNSKEGGNPIGFFGTGLKYAIAVLLRLGHEVTLYSDAKKYVFGVEETKIRNDQFRIVTMNGAPLAFTTELGKNWEPWQAYRELYCNALDEGGRVFVDEDPQPDNGQVLVTVKGPTIMEVYHSHETYFPDFGKMQLVLANERVQIFDRPSNYVYYKGIRVASHRHGAVFTYNIIDNHKLTEDRTVASEWDTEFKLRSALCGATDETVLRKALMMHDNFDTFESNPPFYAPSNEFINFIYKNRHSAKIHPDALAVCRAKMGMAFYETELCSITAREQATIDRALKLIEKIHSPVKAPILVTENLPPHKMAYVVKGQDKIWLNRAVLSQGTNRVASTLYEEALHLYKDLDDCSRDMQNFLLDTLFGLVEDL